MGRVYVRRRSGDGYLPLCFTTTVACTGPRRTGTVYLPLFSLPMKVPGLAPLDDESKSFSAAPGWISADNCRLYLSTTYDGTSDIYVAWRK